MYVIVRKSKPLESSWDVKYSRSAPITQQETFFFVVEKVTCKNLSNIY